MYPVIIDMKRRVPIDKNDGCGDCKNNINGQVGIFHGVGFLFAGLKIDQFIAGFSKGRLLKPLSRKIGLMW